MTDDERSNYMYDLLQVVSQVPDDKRPVAEALYQELVFMRETLEELKHTVKAQGVVERFEQGKQRFLRESPALKSYNTTIQRYSALYKQLTALVEPVEPCDDNDGPSLEEFLKD